VRDFIDDLGLSMPSMEDVSSGQLLALVDRAWDTREELRRRITDALPPLRERARRTHEILLELLCRR
jgi:hypothetical protein